jgi:hypothetical protein
MFLATKWQSKARLLLVICEQRVGAYDGDNSFFEDGEKVSMQGWY